MVNNDNSMSLLSIHMLSILLYMPSDAGLGGPVSDPVSVRGSSRSQTWSLVSIRGSSRSCTIRCTPYWYVDMVHKIHYRCICFSVTHIEVHILIPTNIMIQVII